MHGTNLGETTVRRRLFQWPKEAVGLVAVHRNAGSSQLRDLIAQLVQISCNPRAACWRFVRRLGVRGTITSRLWTDAEHRRLLQLIERQPVAEVAKTLRRSERAIRIKLGELGANSHIGKDWFMPGTLASALHVSREKVQRWIDRGWLKATEQSAGKVKRVLIAADDFCRFCRQYRQEVICRALSEARLDFIQSFVFPPSHAELLPVRASKIERAAYLAQMERQEGDGNGDDELERSPDGVDPSTHAFPPRSEEPGTDPLRGEVCA